MEQKTEICPYLNGELHLFIIFWYITAELMQIHDRIFCTNTILFK